MADEPRNTINVRIADQHYSLTTGDVTGAEARDFRRATGFTLHGGLQEMVAKRVDSLEVIAGIAWLDRRRSEPNLKYEAVLASCTYDNAAFTDPSENPNPPAEGGSG